MKTLYLMRHAKSSWDDNSLADFDRPLNDRGRLAAQRMGGLMRDRGFKPDIILCSPALRAKQTTDLVISHSGFDSKVHCEPRIYEASPNELLRVLSELAAAITSVLFVGHNPGMEGILRFITGRIEPMPTAALAVIDLADGRWDVIEPGSGRLREIIRPKEQFVYQHRT